VKPAARGTTASSWLQGINKVRAAESHHELLMHMM